MRYLFLIILMLGFGSSALANPTKIPQLGQDYMLLAKPVTTAPDKIEVRQFFSYRCWPCYQQSLLLQPLVRVLPEDVVFVRTALPSGGNWTSGNNELKVYYALEQMKVTDKVHLTLLKSSGVRGDEALKPKAITNVMVANRVSADRFNKAYDSPAVVQKVGQGKRLAQYLGIQSVPAIVVNGKYLVTGSSENTNRIIKHLIEVERKAQRNTR